MPLKCIFSVFKRVIIFAYIGSFFFSHCKFKLMFYNCLFIQQTVTQNTQCFRSKIENQVSNQDKSKTAHFDVHAFPVLSAHDYLQLPCGIDNVNHITLSPHTGVHHLMGDTCRGLWESRERGPHCMPERSQEVACSGDGLGVPLHVSPHNTQSM